MNVLWLNKETLEERVLHEFFYFNDTSSWVRVPEGATFATGDKYDFVFRKDGYYYDCGGWIPSDVTLCDLLEHEFLNLFWVKGGLKETVATDKKHVNNKALSNNFVVDWEQVFGEKFVDSVSKAVKKNKGNTMKNDTFTLERLLGCEVRINYSGVTGYITDIFGDGVCLYICCGNSFDVVSKHNLTFFTEDGDELVFDEYVAMYYGEC